MIQRCETWIALGQCECCADIMPFRCGAYGPHMWNQFQQHRVLGYFLHSCRTTTLTTRHGASS